MKPLNLHTQDHPERGLDEYHMYGRGVSDSVRTAAYKPCEHDTLHHETMLYPVTIIEMENEDE